MAHYLELILITFAVLAVVYAVRIIKGDKETRYTSDNILFVICAIGSAIWSVCFGELLVQTDFEVAYLFRSVGLFGTFSLLIAAVFLVASWSKLPNWLLNVFRGISLTGFIIYPFNARRELIEFAFSPFGVSYSFKKNVWIEMYNVYAGIIGAILVIILVHMIFSRQSRNRERYIGKVGMGVFAVIFTGSLFDTLFPMLGYPSFPGSTLTQFFAIILLYKIVDYSNKYRMTIGNVAYKLFSSTKIAIVIYDDRGNLVRASKEADELLGIKERPKNSLKVSDIFEIDSFDSSLYQPVQYYDTKIRNTEIYCRVEINSVVNNTDDLIGYIVYVSDATERVHFIRKLEEEKIKADEANKAKSTFLANMSHEIRTPINTVLGMNEMIRRESTTPEIKGYSENIRVAGEGLLSIINDILDFSKIEAGKIEIVEATYSLGTTLTSLVTMFSLKSQEKGLDFLCDVSPDLPNTLLGDELRIRQVLMNILSNAVKYTEHGHVSFTVRGHRIDADTHEISFEIGDTGMGIKPEDKEKLFSTFTRLNNDQTHYVEGTGLGLSIVKAFTELLGAKLEVESEFGVGSTFRFTLVQKVVGEDSVGAIGLNLYDNKYIKSKDEYTARFVAPNARILVVDDNKMNLAVIKGLLKNTLVKIDTAISGHECIELVRKERYHMILMDHMMPIMDGIETFRILRSMSPEENLSHDAVVIALTANALSGAREQYIGYGFRDYLSKPVEYDKLEEVLEAYLPVELFEDEVAEESRDDKAGIDAVISERVAEIGASLELGLQYCGDVDVYCMTAETFADISGELCDKLTRYRKDRNIDDYRVTIHGVKSNARTLGNETLYKLALTQEEACKNGSFAEIVKLGDLPERMISKFSNGIREVFANNSANQVAGDKKGNITPDELEAKLDLIYNYLLDFDEDKAVAALEDVCSFAIEDSIYMTLGKVTSKVRHFDYDGALRLMEGIRKK